MRMHVCNVIFGGSPGRHFKVAIFAKREANTVQDKELIKEHKVPLNRGTYTRRKFG